MERLDGPGKTFVIFFADFRKCQLEDVRRGRDDTKRNQERLPQQRLICLLRDTNDRVVRARVFLLLLLPNERETLVPRRTTAGDRVPRAPPLPSARKQRGADGSYDLPPEPRPRANVPSLWSPFQRSRPGQTPPPNKAPHTPPIEHVPRSKPHAVASAEPGRTLLEAK